MPRLSVSEMAVPLMRSPGVDPLTVLGAIACTMHLSQPGQHCNSKLGAGMRLGRHRDTHCLSSGCVELTCLYNVAWTHAKATYTVSVAQGRYELRPTPNGGLAERPSKVAQYLKLHVWTRMHATHMRSWLRQASDA